MPGAGDESGDVSDFSLIGDDNEDHVQRSDSDVIAAAATSSKRKHSADTSVTPGKSRQRIEGSTDTAVHVHKASAVQQSPTQTALSAAAAAASSHASSAGGKSSGS